MAPYFRAEELKQAEYNKVFARKAAVMALFYPDQSGQAKLLLILRKTYKGVHSNQIGFPGGKVEVEDRDLLHTALRETEEEVGVPQQAVETLKTLSEVYISPSNFLVQPFLGVYAEPKPFIKQESEVEAIVEVGLADILDENTLGVWPIKTSYANEKVPAYKLNNHIVWGATAMMLSEIIELVKKAL